MVVDIKNIPRPVCDLLHIRAVDYQNVNRAGFLFERGYVMPRVIDRTGQRFGRLTVVALCEKIGRHTAFLCKCDCGNEIKVRSNCLQRGDTKSCGCIRSDMMRAKQTKHGYFYDREYKSWAAMVQRCTNSKQTSYKYYGPRGIKICEAMRDFPGFLEVMGPRPERTSIDRINNDGHYSCGTCSECIENNWPMNCRWADSVTQNNNKRNSRKK